MKRAFTIVEALLALLLLTITVVGSMALYFYSDESMAIATHRRMAAECANSELENLKIVDYADLGTYITTMNGATHSQVDIGDLIKGLRIFDAPVVVSAPDNHTIIKVSVYWQEASRKDVAIPIQDLDLPENAEKVQKLELVTYLAGPNLLPP